MQMYLRCCASAIYPVQEANTDTARLARLQTPTEQILSLLWKPNCVLAYNLHALAVSRTLMALNVCCVLKAPTNALSHLTMIATIPLHDC